MLDAVAPVVDKAVELAPIEERPDDVMLVQIDGAVKVVAGTMLALGKFPRLSATALAATLIPTTRPVTASGRRPTRRRSRIRSSTS